MKTHKKIITTALVLFLATVFYAAWYSWNREQKIAQIGKCAYAMEHPKMLRAPDGKLTPVYDPTNCLIEPTPPAFPDLIRGRINLGNIQKGLQVKPYTFWDILLGNYSLIPDSTLPCDQTATTTDCSTILSFAQPISL